MVSIPSLPRVGEGLPRAENSPSLPGRIFRRAVGCGRPLDGTCAGWPVSCTRSDATVLFREQYEQRRQSPSGPDPVVCDLGLQLPAVQDRHAALHIALCDDDAGRRRRGVAGFRVDAFRADRAGPQAGYPETGRGGRADGDRQKTVPDGRYPAYQARSTRRSSLRWGRFWCSSFR